MSPCLPRSRRGLRSPSGGGNTPPRGRAGPAGGTRSSARCRARCGPAKSRTTRQVTVMCVAIDDGDAVTAGQVICVVEAMKMENEVHALRAGVVSELSVREGEAIATGSELQH